LVAEASDSLRCRQIIPWYSYKSPEAGNVAHGALNSIANHRQIRKSEFVKRTVPIGTEVRVIWHFRHRCHSEVCPQLVSLVTLAWMRQQHCQGLDEVDDNLPRFRRSSWEAR
jgi:hypothetical protein